MLAVADHTPAQGSPRPFMLTDMALGGGSSPVRGADAGADVTRERSPSTTACRLDHHCPTPTRYLCRGSRCARCNVASMADSIGRGCSGQDSRWARAATIHVVPGPWR